MPPFLLVMLALAAPAQVVAAEGHWAALARGQSCEAVSASLAPALKDRPQARVSITFDAAANGRNGELALLLSRPPRGGSSVMLTIGDKPFLLTARGELAWSAGPAQEAALLSAMRGGGSMSVEARSPSGGRIVDRYLLDGAPTTIDAAAACAARLANR
jgi:hypothetical protein